MKRPRALLALCVGVALALYLYFPLPAPDIPPPRAGDCVLMHLWSNGYHTDLGVPADALPAGHPLRVLFPHARTLLIGWGEQAFYFSDGSNLWLALDALVPPSPSVMHVVAGAEGGSAYLGSKEDETIAVSREGAASLAAFLRDALVLDPQGRVEITSPGKVIGASYFVRARENFHLFNVCNHWMARALRAAGLNINWRDKWMGDPLMAAAHHAAPSVCPGASGIPI